MICGVQALTVLHEARLLLRPANNAVDSLIDGFGRDLLLVLASGKQSRFVQNVSQISAGKAWGAARNKCQVDVVGQRLALRVHCQHLLATALDSCGNTNLTVETTRSQ